MARRLRRGKALLILAVLVAAGFGLNELRRAARRWYHRYAEEESTGRFQDPEGLAVDAEGMVYVADENRKRLTVLDPAGATVASLQILEGYPATGEPMPFTAGDSLVAVAPGRVVAIASGFDFAEIEVREGRGRLVRVIGKGKGSGRGELGDAEGIAWDADAAELWVTDEDNRRIASFSATGEALSEWPVPADPEGLCLHGVKVYVTFSKDDWIGRFSRVGELELRFGRTGSGPGELRGPDFVLASPRSALLYVADRGNDRIQVFDLEGVHRRTIGGQGREPGMFLGPEDLAFTPDGSLLVADSGNHRIQVLSAEGAPLRTFE
jgi:DNA-binding beta-propeller fold protein YncE